MYLRKSAVYAVCLIALMAVTDMILAESQAPEMPGRDLLYIGLPGIGSEVKLGGVGILVLDASNNYEFVKRISTWDYAASQGPEPVKGVSASAETQMLYITTNKRLAAFDLMTDKLVWENDYDGQCCDRAAISPDGKILYLPSRAGAQKNWVVIDARTGKLIAKVDTPQSERPHNTLWSLDGSRVFMSGNAARFISIADPSTHKVVQTVGPFTQDNRVFTVNGAGTLIFNTMVDLMGFEIGDVRTGKVIHRVEVPEGWGWKGRRYGHGTPSHGVALSPDEKEVWVADGVSNAIHMFDATVMPPKYSMSIELRSHPAWITYSLDGKRIYPSTGDVIDAATKKIIGGWFDEHGRAVESEKIVDIRYSAGKPIKVGNSFGIGQVRAPRTSSAF